MTDDRNQNAPFPVLVASQIRFAVVGPGDIAPEVILASGEDVSDLVGFYSIKEAGLGKILEFPKSSSSFFRDFFNTSKSNKKIIQSIDVKVSPPDEGSKEFLSQPLDRRLITFSLIVNYDHTFVEVGNLLLENSSGLEGQLEGIARAYMQGDVRRVQYFGQMLSTFMTLVYARSEDKARALSSSDIFQRNFFGIFSLAMLATAVTYLVNLLNSRN